MELWSIWYWCVAQLRPAFSRQRTFLWALLALAGLSIRQDLLGVTSIVRALGLKDLAYRSLLNNFHSRAIDAEELNRRWLGLVLRIFKPVTQGQYIFLLLDGLKVAKEGKKMPGVKCLHQESNDNSKAPYVMGHSLQCLALLAKGTTGSMAAVPLLAQIHEGIVWSNRDQRTLNDKAAALIFELRAVTKKALLVIADAYYCNAKFLTAIVNAGCHVISRVRDNASAYYLPEMPLEKKRGRPKKYGEKVVLASFFDRPGLFTTVASQLYGEDGSVELRYYAVNLLWKPTKSLMRFILVVHPTRGKSIFATTDLTLDPVVVLEAYGYRQKIEVSFKQALHVIGTYSYHFWMKGMDAIKRFSGDQYLHRKTQRYRDEVRRKLKAYATHITFGCIAQGLLLHLCLNHGATVWQKFGSWLRTMKKDQAPSELVAANALRTMLPDFLAGSGKDHAFKKFLLENMDTELGRVLRLTG